MNFTVFHSWRPLWNYRLQMSKESYSNAVIKNEETEA